MPPTAAFTPSCTNLDCSFTDNSSDSDGSVVGWSWDFGDGTSSTAQNPSKSYAAAGDYTVTLTVTDDDGDTASTSQVVSVSDGATNQPPTANFSSSCVFFACNFTDLSSDSDGTIVSWNWDFGDGTSSTAQNPSKTYPRIIFNRFYDVTLTVTDDDGESTSITINTQVF